MYKSIPPGSSLRSLRNMLKYARDWLVHDASTQGYFQYESDLMEEEMSVAEKSAGLDDGQKVLLRWNREHYDHEIKFYGGRVAMSALRIYQLESAIRVKENHHG